MKILLPILIILALGLFWYIANATDSGALSPSTLADDDTVGTVAWTDPTNAGASDDAKAIADHGAPADFSHYLRATNFGFSVPTGATIDGILVEIEMSTGTGAQSCSQSEIKIVKADGTIGTTNKSTGAILPSSDQYVSFGSSSDAWGETWTAENINDVDFGVVLSTQSIEDQTGNASVDHIRITVYYTEEGDAKIQIRSGVVSIKSGSVILE